MILLQRLERKESPFATPEGPNYCWAKAPEVTKSAKDLLEPLLRNRYGHQRGLNVVEVNHQATVVKTLQSQEDSHLILRKRN